MTTSSFEVEIEIDLTLVINELFQMAFQNKYTSLRLNGILHHKQDLLALTSKKRENISLWQQSLYQFIQEWLDDRDVVSVQTSGSTGTPKKIQLLKTAMVNSAKMTGRYFHFQQGQTALLCLPCSYIAGKMMVVRAFVWGLDLKLVEPVGNPMETIKQSVDFAAMVPLQVAKMLEKTPEKAALLTQLIIGGGKVSERLNEQLQTLSVQCYATYGMTETITHIAIQKLNGPDKTLTFHALPEVSLSLDDRDCLVIDAPAVAKEQVVTNDIVRLVTPTQFEWLGRFDNVINTGGVKVFPEQIEKKLDQIVKTRFFINYLADEILGQRVILIIEDKPWSLTQQAGFKTKMYKVLSKYEQPKQLFFVEEFIETPTKKVQRIKTKALLNLS